VYDLFLIRNQKIRSSLILAKFSAVYICLIIAATFSIIIGLIIDYFMLDLTIDALLEDIWDPITISFAAMAIACAAGILIGILVESVPAAAILAIYLGNQLSLIAVLPVLFFEELDPVIFATGIGIALTGLFLTIDVILFNRKQF
jgi:hypothetical protein